MFKKDFQKTISIIRKELAIGDYPKAMCTSQQYGKGTATVNCGGQWLPDESKNIAELVMNHPEFKDFLSRHGATAKLEKSSNWTQIRIYFAE